MASICINDTLTDDELGSILSKLENDKDKEIFGLVCKRWLAGPHMLQKMAARFSRLIELDLSQSISRSFYPGVTDSDLAVIADGFRFLKVLNLQNCKGITDKGMASIGGGLSSLQSLNVCYCRKLTDKGLLAVAKGSQGLRSLHLDGCKFVTDEVLKALSKNCPNLEELGLQGCTSITDCGLADLVSGCRQIHFLDINKCSNVGDSGVSTLLDCFRVGNKSILSLARFCENLETLIIGGCRDISDESIKSLAVSCRSSLKNLRMDWCLNISNSSISCILTECRNLEALDIGCCEEVTDAVFHGLGAMGTEMRLKVLKISNCPKITVAGIGMLLDNCNSLEYLDVRSCPHITKSGCDVAGLQFPDFCKVNFTGSLNEPDVLL
ncbi:F-box/LRR-repeat protein [Salix suchowensis]|nr:F-box/LRR-repeat protein [Salix suchowensis]